MNFIMIKFDHSMADVQYLMFRYFHTSLITETSWHPKLVT